MSRCRERVLVQVILVLGAAASASELAAPQKAPIPDAHALEMQKAAGELFGTRFRSAKTPADKSAVAAEMIEAALRLQDGTVDQYVLLKMRGRSRPVPAKRRRRNRQLRRRRSGSTCRPRNSRPRRC